jgi:hypothetical protein
MKRITLTILCTLTAFPLASHASSIGNYDIAVDIRSNQGLDIGMALGGWDCHTSSNVTFTERLPDHKGRMKDIPREISSKWNGHMFDQSNKHNFPVERNMARADDKLNVRVSQSCRKEISEIAYRDVYCKRANGTEYICDEEAYETTRTLSFYKHWKCEFKNDLPTQVGSAKAHYCQPDGNESFGLDGDLERMLLQHLSQKEIIVKARLNDVKEKYVADFCDRSNVKNKMVIQLSQGVGGHMGEDDFIVKAKIDDKQVDIPLTSGILDHEIAYCPDRDDVRINISAVEDDMVWDDEYKPEQEGLRLTREGTDSNAIVRLKRHSYTGATDTDHNILVKVMDRSDRKVRAPATDAAPALDQSGRDAR